MTDLRTLVILALLPGFLLAYCTQPSIDRNGKAIQIHICCRGYKRSSTSTNKLKCEPECSSSCGNGTCAAPQRCRCDEGYENINRNPSEPCEPVCSNECPNGRCVAPNTCGCNIDYQKNEDGQCTPSCANGCPNGLCLTPGNCTCNPGYSQEANQTCRPVCPNGCPQDRTCVAPNTCGCQDDYMDLASFCMPARSEFLFRACKRWILPVSMVLLSLLALACSIRFIHRRRNIRVEETQMELDKCLDSLKT